MSRKADLSKKNDAGYYQSAYNTTRKFNKDNYDVLTIRIPKGDKECLKNYQQQMHLQQPDNPKYNSLNSLINSLLNHELSTNKDKA